MDSNAVLNPATAINIGGVSITPTFNNDQFNDALLVGTVNNDPIRTSSKADPVSTVSGNNYHDEADFVIRGRNGLNIVFTRNYNSAPSATKQNRGLGYGWTHSYLMRLKSNDFGECPNCSPAQKPENGSTYTSSITYTDERGGEQNYLVNESTYGVTAPKGVYDTLALDSPAAGQHTLTFRNGVKYIFEVPSGNLKTTPGIVARLKYIDNAWGDRLTIGYDTNGRLSTLTDNLGITGAPRRFVWNATVASLGTWLVPRRLAAVSRPAAGHPQGLALTRPRAVQRSPKGCRPWPFRPATLTAEGDSHPSRQREGRGDRWLPPGKTVNVAFHTKRHRAITGRTGFCTTCGFTARIDVHAADHGLGGASGFSDPDAGVG